MSRPEWNPIPLEFEIAEEEPGLPVGYSLTILSVERDIHGIRINYEIAPPLPPRDASRLHIRMSWAPEDASPWQQPAQALRISV